MPPTFIVVPQWQGSVSPRAMRLSDGAEAISGDLPAAHTRSVTVPVEAGDALDTGVHRYSALHTVRERLAHELRATSDWALTVGGDCGVSLTAVEHASVKHPDALSVVWFDAHPDLHTPETSLSGAFTGMVLRAISGEGAEGLALTGAGAVPLSRIVLAGIRDLDDAEADLIGDREIAAVPVAALDTPDALIEALSTTGGTAIYVHIDLDVLDPAVITGLGNAVPFGLTVEALTAAITALKSEYTLAGATIAGFAPVTPEAANDDLSVILRIIGALTR